MSAVKFGVIVPVLNKRSLLEPSLAAILHAAGASSEIEVLCLDHGSTDGSREYLQGVEEIGLLGVSGGHIGFLRNEGARHTTAPVLVFVDSDVVIPPDYFVRLSEILAIERVDAVGCEYTLPANPHWIERTWYRLTVKRGDGPRAYINAGNFAVRRQAFDAVGGFSEALSSGEDTDICRRLLAAGFRIEQRQALGAAHLGNPKSVRSFFQKQVWHGMGAPLVTRPHIGIDLTPALVFLWTATTLLAIVSGIVAVAFQSVTWVCLAGFLLAFAPVLVLVYRAVRNRTIPPVVPSLFLISVFCAARAVAMLRAYRGQAAGPSAQGPQVKVLRTMR